MDLHHPWRDLRGRPHLIIHWDHLPPGMSGATDGRRIYLERNLLQVERRCTLAHELVHVDMGHVGCQPPDVEWDVRRRTARKLLTVGQVVRVAPWAHDVAEAADELWVTHRVLMDYLHSVTEDECAQIRDAVSRRDH